uniref:Transient receptor potential cation channel subfamily M member 3 n=1 Tax=Magallana gigas TaxID=29159 RepID=K1RG60_MAGGI
MDSKEANVESASAYSGVIPGRSLNQPQHELIGSPRRREAREEEEKKEEEEESHGNQKNADKEPTQVKRSSEGYSKKGKTSEVNDSTDTYTNQRITNKSLSNADPAVELALVKSNGTYTQNDDDKDCVGETRQNRKEPMGLSKKITARRINETSFRNFVTKSKIMIRIPLKEDELENAHTKPELSDSFGIIDNTGFAENDALTRYLRCVPDTKADIIWTMLIDQWHLKRPQLIISVTGDAQRFDLKRTMQENFENKALAAGTTMKTFFSGDFSGWMGTWIITGGTQSGVWELMGDAVKDHNSSWERKNDVVVLGVAPWGCVANRQALEEEEEENVPQGKIHTHFILIDDGSENKFGGEIEFRSRLEKFISEQRVDPHDKDSSRTIPAISIIVGGDINTMKVIWQSVMNRIPVLVLQSSGGVADFIALGYKITTNLYNKEESFFPLTFDEDIKDLVDIIFAWKAEDLPKKQKLVESCLKQLREALQHRELIEISATRSNTNTQLSLALAWNMPDIAKNEIFTASNKTNYQKLDLHDAMMSALIQDRLEFVKLFLENGIDLSQFLDIHNLWKLFCFNDKNDASAQLLRNLMDRPVLVRMKKMKNEPLDISEYLYCIGQVIADLLCNNAMSFVYNPRLLAVNPTKNLFIWAILMNRMSLAIHLWRIGNDHVGTALFASCLLKKLSKEAYEEDELELSTTLKKHSLEFEKLASEVLGICYLKSRYLSHQLLVRELKEFGNTTLFCMAEENILMDFLAQTCCQTKLSAIWKKHMALSTSRKKIVATILMPLSIFAIIFVDKKALRDKLDDLDPLNLTEENCMPEQQDVAVCKDRHVKIRGLNGKVAPFPGFKSKDEQHWCNPNWCCDNFRSFYTAPVTKFITAMLNDLKFFLLILLVFILSFGVTYQANLYPNAPQEWSVLQDVLYHPYWQMYGELFLENKEGKDPSEDLGTCTKNETLWRSGEKERCPEKSFLVVLLMAVFLLLTNVLLLNLLIAMFSDTVKKVHENSEKEWRFHRFSLVYEYYNRPFLFPPLNILDYFVKIIQWCCNNNESTSDNKKDTSFREKLSKKEQKQLSQFERNAMEEYMRSKLTLEKDKTDKKIQTTDKRVDRVNEKVDEIKDKIITTSGSGTARRGTRLMSLPAPKLTTNVTMKKLSKCLIVVGDSGGVWWN